MLHAGINTMAVEKIEGENYMSDTARVLSPKVTFDVEARSRSCAPCSVRIPSC